MPAKDEKPHSYSARALVRMEPMHTCRCEAIVLGVMDYREADKIVTLFTLDHGKLKGIARGAKRSVRRFGGAWSRSPGCPSNLL